MSAPLAPHSPGQASAPDRVGQANAPDRVGQAHALDRWGLNRWLQTFLTIIAGTAVAVIAWAVIQRFLHIIALLVAALLVAYILDPLVVRLQRGGLRRGLAILVAFLGLFSVIGLVLLLCVWVIHQAVLYARVLPTPHL